MLIGRPWRALKPWHGLKGQIKTMSCLPPKEREASGFLARLQASARLVVFLTLILASASLPLGAWQIHGMLFCLLLALALASKPQWKPLAWRLVKALPFVLLACLSLWLNPRPGARALAMTATAKAVYGLFALGLLNALTPFPEMLQGLRRLRIPSLLVRLLGFTWRFGMLLGEEARGMRRGIAARSWQGRWIWQVRILGHLIGGLFLRALERAERVHAAMLARGYDPAQEGMHEQQEAIAKPFDLALASLVMAMAVALRLAA
jgi:cobalt/nickel transport system permease protein